MEKKKEKIQLDILKFVSTKEHCAFGEIVKEMDYNYDQVLANVIELKQMGLLIKMDKKGHYITSTELDNKG